jgi:hypothetical protein
MSESVSADVGVSVDAPAPVSPAPNTQPAISISDAARMLRSARPAAQPQAPQRDVAGAAEAPAAAPAQEAPQEPAEAAPKRLTGVEAMERALGLKPAEAAPEGAEEASQEPSPAGFEFEGRRFSEAELRRELNLAKDYTYKTQQLAQQQREVQEAQNLLAQFLPTIAPEIQRMQQQFQQTQPPDPLLKQINPQEYAERMNAFYESWAHNQRYEQMQKQMDQARGAAIAKAVDEGNRYLSDRWEFWANPQQRNEVTEHVRKFATQDLGFSDAEMNGVTNPKIIEALLYAMAGYRMLKGTPRTEAPAPVVRAAPPRGSAPPPRPVEAVSAAQQAFEAKPSWQNGAALLTAQQVAARRSGNGHTNW